MHVSISAQHIIIPRQCMCCGETADHQIAASARRTTGKRVKKTEVRGWNFPYCTACAKHAKARNQADSILAMGLVFTAVMVYVLHYVLIFAIPLGIICAVLIIWFYRRAMTKAKALQKAACPSCTATIRYTGWSGSVHTFAVDSDAYAVALMRANAGKLINVSAQARQLLEKVVTPVQPVTGQPTTGPTMKLTDGTVSSSPDTVTQLERLARLREQGVLTDAEFQSQKQKLLNV